MAEQSEPNRHYQYWFLYATAGDEYYYKLLVLQSRLERDGCNLHQYFPAEAAVQILGLFTLHFPGNPPSFWVGID